MQEPISPRFNPVNFYLGFSGRINRKQWLYGVLPTIALQAVASILISVLVGQVVSTLTVCGFHLGFGLVSSGGVLRFGE